MAFALITVIVWLALLPITRACLRMRMPLIAAALAPALLLYLGSLVAGAVGLYSPLVVLISILVVTAAAAASSSRVPPRVYGGETEVLFAGDPDGDHDGALIGVVAGFSIIAAIPIGGFLSPAGQLHWDTVSYHLPSFVEFLHNGTLWVMEGPFHSYHFGYELIANVPTLFSKGAWGVRLGHTMGLLLALLAIAELARFVASPTAGRLGWLRWSTIGAGTVASWCYLFANNLRAIGKNDVFTMVCLLGSLTVALRAAEHSRDPGRVVPWAAACGGLLGLAAATKPTALAVVLVVVPFFGFVAPARTRLRAMIACGLGVALIGGFWPLRNLVLLGGLTDPSVSILWTRTVVAQLGSAALYQPTRALLPWSLAGIALVVLSIRWTRADKGTPARHRLGLLLGFLVVGVVAFAVAPAGVHVVEGQARWSFRLGMATFVVAAMVVIAFAVEALGRLRLLRSFKLKTWLGIPIGMVAASFVVQPAWWVTPVSTLAGLAGTLAPAFLVVAWYRPLGRRFVRFAIAAGCVGVIALVIAHDRYGSIPIDGMPGYEVVGKRPRTGIYHWVQALDEPARIYAVALRPWGLYGPRLQHRVFYDLHAAPLASPNGINRLKRVLARFHPDLVIISIDPHQPNENSTMPKRAWLQAEPCMTLAYQDETAAAFRVEGGCEHLTTAPWLDEAKFPRPSG